ncbi:hypothetical protein FKM82_010057 [Ascaphus truei]
MPSLGWQVFMGNVLRWDSELMQMNPTKHSMTPRKRSNVRVKKIKLIFKDTSHKIIVEGRTQLKPELPITNTLTYISVVTIPRNTQNACQAHYLELWMGKGVHKRHWVSW